jgi:hypothetical protein
MSSALLASAPVALAAAAPARRASARASAARMPAMAKVRRRLAAGKRLRDSRAAACATQLARTCAFRPSRGAHRAHAVRQLTSAVCFP